MKQETASTPNVLRYVLAILGIVAVAVAAVLVFLYVVHQDEIETRDGIQSVHLESVAESQELAREARMLRELIQDSLDSRISDQSGPAGIHSVQLGHTGVLQSMRSRLLQLSMLQPHQGDDIFSMTLERLIDRFDRIDRTLRDTEFDPDVIAAIDVLSMTIEQYDRLHKIAADTKLRELADRQGRRPGFLAVLALCLIVSGLAALYLMRSLRAALQRQRETEVALVDSQEKLHHIQKLDALGRLVGGVAHDFNNWLTVILGHAGLLLEKTDGDERLDAGLTEIKQASLQAASLTQQLLAFSRRQQFEPRVVDLNDLIREMEEMLQRIIGADARLTFSYAADLFDVELDPDQFQQMILNLINNARDAMPGGGSISVSTDNVTVWQGDTEVDGVPEGEYARLTVSDTGIGMDNYTRERVFEPFFTTKEKGHGTGLGLSTVHGIVTASKGLIFVESREGSGSKFIVYLPRAEHREEAAPDAREALLPDKGSATVLVAEDNEQVRRFVATGLSSLGYRVLTASGGADGLRICRTEPGTIDVILSDVVMPETSGPNFIAGALKLRPDADAIYMSAYTRDEILKFRRHNAEVDIPLIQKPFEIAALARLIQEQLNQTASP